MGFQQSLQQLLEGLDPAHHGEAVAMLRRCRRLDDLDALAGSGGWLTPQGRNPRLRLVKHGSGTFLVLAYDEGWGTTLVQADFWR